MLRGRNPLVHDGANSSVVIPECVTAMISARPLLPAARTFAISPFSRDANGSFAAHSGCFGASAFTRSSAKRSWNGSGFSVHSVPSLSNVAMRSGTGTKSDEPSFVTLATKSPIAFFVVLRSMTAADRPRQQPLVSSAVRRPATLHRSVDHWCTQMAASLPGTSWKCNVSLASDSFERPAGGNRQPRAGLPA